MPDPDEKTIYQANLQEISVIMNAAIGAFEGMRLCQPVSRPAAQLMQRCRAPQRACGHRMAVTARTTEVGVGLFGTKAGMTQIFTADGLAVPATVIALEEGNVVVQVKTPETDGYSSVQVPPSSDLLGLDE